MRHARTIGMILALAGTILLLIGLIAPVFQMEPASEPSVGIIGGADGPTYLLTLKAADGLFLWMAIAGAVMTVVSAVLLIAGRKKR